LKSTKNPCNTKPQPRSPETLAKLRELGVRDDFPLFPHQTDRWAKKIRGQLVYFGPLAEPEAAMRKWLEQKDELLEGMTPKDAKGYATVRDVVNAFLTSKELARDKGEISRRTFSDYHATCERLIECLGRTGAAAALAPADFLKYAGKISKWAPVTRANEIQRVRTIFKYAYEAVLIDKPMLFGPDFKKPAVTVVRKDKATKPTRLFAPAEIQQLLKAAPIQLRAMIFLGVNAGLGNSDISGLNWAHLDLTKGVLNYPRPKTGVDRRATLWPETVKALRALKKWSGETLRTGEGRGMMRYRPAEATDVDAVFISKQQRRFVRHDGDTIRDSVALAFGKLLREAGIKRKGINFYSLRHSFETAAMGAKDREATDRIMGHIDPHVRSNYQHWQADAEEDARLRAVTNHVRAWLGPVARIAKGKATPVAE